MSRLGYAEGSDVRGPRLHSSARLLLLLTLAARCGVSIHGDDLLLDAHARVFVAELPPKYNLHTVTAEGCEDGAFLKGILTNPLGVPFKGDLDLALYRDTPYYSLELHVHLQMLYSPLRVLTADEADIVYVPLYATQMHFSLGGEGVCKPKWTQPAQDAVIAQFWADAPTLLPLLGAKPHWMQLSEIEWMIHRGCSDDEGWGVPLACHSLAKHMIFATPESLTDLHPRHGHQRFASGRPASNNTVTIPYMGHVHRASMQQRAKLLAEERVGAKKAYVASMCFRSMRGTQLRADLARQCDAAPDECWNVRNGSILDIVESYRRAWFCVQPYGDSPTRSAIMDCIASGLAVPCVFDEFLFDMLPFADVIDYRAMVAYIPADDVMAPGNASFLDWLRHYDGAARAAMLSSLQAVSQALQYAVQPNHLLVRHDRLAEVDPLDDAFTMSVKAVLRHACRLNHRQCRQPHAGHGARHKAGEGAGGGRRPARSR